MITESFPSKRPKVVPTYYPQQQQGYKPPWYSPGDVAQSIQRKITTEEYIRRDKIVHELVNASNWFVGDTAFPSNKKDYEKYGVFLVEGIVSSYKDFATDHVWPPSDEPLILTIKNLHKPPTILFCSSSWIVKKNPHLMLTEC